MADKKLWYLKVPYCSHIITDTPELFYPDESDMVTPWENSHWSALPMLGDSSYSQPGKFERWIAACESNGDLCIVQTEKFQHWPIEAIDLAAEYS
jgi:hypothetical protein